MSTLLPPKNVSALKSSLLFNQEQGYQVINFGSQQSFDLNAQSSIWPYDPLPLSGLNSLMRNLAFWSLPWKWVGLKAFNLTRHWWLPFLPTENDLRFNVALKTANLRPNSFFVDVKHDFCADFNNYTPQNVIFGKFYETPEQAIEEGYFEYGNFDTCYFEIRNNLISKKKTKTG